MMMDPFLLLLNATRPLLTKNGKNTTQSRTSDYRNVLTGKEGTGPQGVGVSHPNWAEGPAVSFWVMRAECRPMTIWPPRWGSTPLF